MNERRKKQVQWNKTKAAVGAYQMELIRNLPWNIKFCILIEMDFFILFKILHSDKHKSVFQDIKIVHKWKRLNEFK